MEGLHVRDRGSESYLNVEQRQEVEDGVGARGTIRVEEVRDESEARYGIVYQSKHSYYDLLDARGLSYHQTEKSNSKRSAAQILGRREEIKKTGTAMGRDSTGRHACPARRGMSLSVG